MRMSHIFLCCALLVIVPANLHAQQKAELTHDEYVKAVGGSLFDGKWVVTRKKPTKADRSTFDVSLLRDGGLQELDGSLFGVVCVDNKPVVGFAFSGKNLGNGVKNFEYQIDDQSIKKEKWWALDANIFTPNATSFLESLIGKKKLIVRGYPEESPSVEMSFDIEGIEKVLPLIQNECGWK